MKYSLNWLNRYTKLPMGDTEKLNEIIDRIALQIVDVDERWLQEKDAIIDVDNKIITNRPYCFGHRGLAREIAIMLDQEYTGAEYPLIPVANNRHHSLPTTVKVEDADLCPRFTALAIKGIKVGPSPDFLKYAVESVGLRSINNLVDITNMIMLDTGQPVHAYDYHKIKEGTIIVRRAKDGEKVVTLDGVERILDSSMLLITDHEKVVGIGGVMGAGNSEIDEETTDIILEVANFHPKNIRQTARTLRHRTDAVTRFEKGPDPSNIPNVMACMADLVVQVCGGEVSSEFIDINNLETSSSIKYKPSHMDFDPSRVDKLLGFGIKEDFIERVLKGFDIAIKSKFKNQTNDNEIWELEIPSWRPDVNEPSDLIEDIGRMYGYQNIPSVTPVNQIIAPAYNKKVEALRKIRKALTSSGLDEALTFSFISQNDADVFDIQNAKLKMQNQNLDQVFAIEVINPLSEEYRFLRPTLIPSLTKVAKENVKHTDQFGFFEISRKFQPKNGERKTYEEDHGESAKPDEIEVIGMVYYSKVDKERSIFSLKAAIENMADMLQVHNVKLSTNGDIMLNGDRVGRIGLLSDKALQNYDLDYPLAYCEVELLPFVEAYKDTRAFKPFSKFQGTRLDYSVLIPMDMPVDGVLMTVPEHKLIVNKEIFDVYKNVPNVKDKKSVSFRVYIQKSEGNLTDQDIYAIGVKVEEALNTIQDLEIRGGGVNKSLKSEVMSQEPNLKNNEERVENSKVVVGRLLEIIDHPYADKLVICKVNVGSAQPAGTLQEDTIQVVTGASNIKENKPVGAYVPVALPGAEVKSHKDGSVITIKISKLRGEVSEGMLCSKDELGLDDDIGGIWILNEEEFQGKEGELFVA